MQPSIIGLAIVVALLLTGRLLGASLMVALFASLTFGTTAFATLTALGGSSPLIYTLVTVLMILATIIRRRGMAMLGLALRSYPAGWCILLLGLYAIFGGYLYPRLYAGEIIVFVVTTDIEVAEGLGRAIKEASLEPVTGNLTQIGYFCLSLLSFFAVAVHLLERASLATARRGLFAFACFTAGFGVLDLLAKLSGVPDIFEGIRTASYSLATGQVEAGFWRIAGGFAEASSYSMTTIAAIAFSFTYWRLTGSSLALALLIVLGGLILLSTSTTAYASVAVLAAVAMLRTLTDASQGKIGRSGFTLFVAALGVLGGFCILMLVNESAGDALMNMLDKMVLQKSESQSAFERGYWNEKGIDAFLATGGLGIGLGSSRASSFVVAYLSQLGIVGVALAIPILLSLTLGWTHIPAGADAGLRADDALCRSACSAGLGWLLALALSAGSADPGVLFFSCMAIVVFGRQQIAKRVAHGWRRQVAHAPACPQYA